MHNNRSCTLEIFIGIIGKAPAQRKFNDFKNESIKLIVRVMTAGCEIDRIEGEHQVSTGEHLVRYRRRNWIVENGCIHVDALPAIPMLCEAKLELGVLERLYLIESPLPRRLIDCTALLRSEFPALGDATILSVATLAQLGLDHLAKETLLDFLDPNDKVSQVGHDPSLDSRVSLATPLDILGLIDAPAPNPVVEETDDWTIDWLPQVGWEAPKQDDTELRSLAGHTQGQLGAHVAAAPGAYVIDFDEMLDSDDWQVVIPEMSQPAGARNNTESLLGPPEVSDVSGLGPREATNPKTASLPAQHLTFIAEKTTLLGDTALEVLRYFADNPGDNSSHAELVTECSRGMINGLLNGSLSRYVQKTSSGGWCCHSWVPDVLAIINDNQ